MSRRICITLAALFTLAWLNLINGQDTPAATSTPAGDDLAKLQTENALLKKEVSVQAHTIAQLQAKLAQAGKAHPAATDAPTESEASAPGATYNNSVPITNAAPTGPLKALPLDATNVIANPATPGAPATDAGPSRSYTVVKGDSIWKIAHKMYPGDTKNGVDKIQEANKDAIGGKPLKIGQVLIIPQ